MTLVGYARVSTKEQDPEVQLQALKAAGVDPERIYVDKASGAKTDRPEMANCLKALRAGDTLTVWKLDRLGRSTQHLVSTLDGLRGRGVEFRSLTENMDTNTPQGRMFFGLMAVLAEFERELIRERVMAGIAAARANGRVGGRPRALSAAQIRQITLARAQRPPVPVSELAAAFGVGRATIYRLLERV